MLNNLLWKCSGNKVPVVPHTVLLSVSQRTPFLYMYQAGWGHYSLLVHSELSHAPKVPPQKVAPYDFLPEVTKWISKNPNYLLRPFIYQNM